jgi:hypothetical protein
VQVDAEDTNYDSLKKSAKFYEEDEDDYGYWDKKDKVGAFQLERSLRVVTRVGGGVWVGGWGWGGGW